MVTGFQSCGRDSLSPGERAGVRGNAIFELHGYGFRLWLFFRERRASFPSIRKFIFPEI